MSEPLTKPEHLKPVEDQSLIARSKAAAVAALVGLASFAIVAITQGAVATPDWRVSVPGFALAVVAAVVSLSRREPGYWLWVLGLGLAAAGIVLGWFLMIAVIIAAAAVLIVILHAVM